MCRFASDINWSGVAAMCGLTTVTVGEEFVAVTAEGRAGAFCEHLFRGDSRTIQTLGICGALALEDNDVLLALLRLCLERRDASSYDHLRKEHLEFAIHARSLCLSHCDCVNDAALARSCFLFNSVQFARSEELRSCSA